MKIFDEYANKVKGKGSRVTLTILWIHCEYFTASCLGRVSYMFWETQEIEEEGGSQPLSPVFKKLIKNTWSLHARAAVPHVAAISLFLKWVFKCLSETQPLAMCFCKRVCTIWMHSVQPLSKKNPKFPQSDVLEGPSLSLVKPRSSIMHQSSEKK